MRKVAATGEEAIITDSGTVVAVIISMADYERLHEHADIADALRLRELRSGSFRAMSLPEMPDALGVDVDAFARQRRFSFTLTCSSCNDFRGRSSRPHCR